MAIIIVKRNVIKKTFTMERWNKFMGYKRIRKFLWYISPTAKVIERLELKLVSLMAAVQLISHFATGVLTFVLGD